MKRYFRKSTGAFLAVIMVLSAVASVNTYAVDSEKASSGASNSYTSASQSLDDRYGYDGNDLGATYTPQATTFKVWAPTATDVKVNLYATGSDSESGAQKLSTTALEYNSSTGIWSKTLNGDYKNKYYTYTVTAKNVTGSKTTTKETQDIYSVATGVNGQRSQIVDLDSTDPDGWEKDAHVLLDKQTDSFVWEVHVKDFSYDTKSGVSAKNRGKFLAFTEKGTTLNNDGRTPTMVDYLKNLGVTTVQITPFYDFNKGSVDETGPDTQFNWGYDPVNYNVPDGSYSTNPYDGNVRIKECKQMIQALHNAGISVVMDVVYNHTFSAEESSFEKCVPNYYYRMKADGKYSDGSGCGNETASERRMYRNFMIQSCLYWVNEYHIDGFRFDLMGIHDVETMNLLREAMDKVDPRIVLWGEGWTGGSCNYPEKTCTGSTFRAADQSNASHLSERVAYFNDGIRDAIKGSVFDLSGKGWVQGASSSLTNMNYGILANTTTAGTGRWTARQPSQTVTYASCHDNQTLWDRLAFSQNITNFRARNETLAAQNKLVGGLLNMSQGVTFMLAGEEMGRSKDNDENSYKSPATLNMIDWSNVQTNSDIVEYYKGMREIREKFSPLRDNTNNSASGYKAYTSSGAKVVLDASRVNTGNVNWFAWTWPTGGDGQWVAAKGTNSSDITFDGVAQNIIFVALDPAKCGNGANPSWDAKIAQTG
ncbi:MAG: type I pullulanase, partial [Ruminococcus sp.]|nr:type I pullulanase [Ruminococcus sp.]